MFDNLFTGVLTLSLLAAGALAFGADASRDMKSAHAPLLAATVDRQAAPMQVVMLPTVYVTGRRQAEGAVRLAAN